MNTNYLAIVLWVGSLIAQFLAYLWLAQRQKGKDESRMIQVVDRQVDIQNDHVKLEMRVLQLETQVANVRGWLLGSFGKRIDGGDD